MIFPLPIEAFGFFSKVYFKDNFNLVRMVILSISLYSSILTFPSLPYAYGFIDVFFSIGTQQLAQLSFINIGISFLVIASMILYYVTRKRETPLKKLYLLFAALLATCSMAFLVQTIGFSVQQWQPFSSYLWVGTAFLSTTSVVIFYRLFPQVLTLKNSYQLNQIIHEKTLALESANKKLRDNEALLTALINHNPDVIVMMDKNLTYQYINDSLASVTDTSAKAMIGKRPDEVFPNHTHTDLFIKSIQSVFASGESITYEVEANTETQGHSYFEMRLVPLTNITNEVAGVLSITKDITLSRRNQLQLRSTIEQMEQLNNRLERKRGLLQSFTNIVSHNLRSHTSSLNSLIGLYQRSNEPDRKEQLLQMVFKVAAQLNATITDLGEVLNINNNQQWHTLQFETVLKSQIDSLGAQILSTKADVTYNFEGCTAIDYPKIYLESIFLNLLTNAIKYRSSTRNPKIHFSTHKNEHGHIHLICKDNGQGIDLALYGHKIFSMHQTFHKNDDARGIGLFITKQQILSLGGSIHVDSRPDEGATFTIVFNDSPAERITIGDS